MNNKNELDKILEELTYIEFLFTNPDLSFDNDYFMTWTNPINVDVDLKGNCRTECSTKPA